MANTRCFYLAEGQCEEKLVRALQEKPNLVLAGKVKRFNVIQNLIPEKRLIEFTPGCTVILVFDTDTPETDCLKKNIGLLRTKGLRIEVKTVAQVLNFEDEIQRSTDVRRAQDLTKSESTGDFKSAVNRMKASEFRGALKRHNLDMKELWNTTPPGTYDFISHDGDKIKLRGK